MKMISGTSSMQTSDGRRQNEREDERTNDESMRKRSATNINLPKGIDRGDELCGNFEGQS